MTVILAGGGEEEGEAVGNRLRDTEALLYFNSTLQSFRIQRCVAEEIGDLIQCRGCSFSGVAFLPTTTKSENAVKSTVI